MVHLQNRARTVPINKTIPASKVMKTNLPLRKLLRSFSSHSRVSWAICSSCSYDTLHSERLPFTSSRRFLVSFSRSRLARRSSLFSLSRRIMSLMIPEFPYTLLYLMNNDSRQCRPVYSQIYFIYSRIQVIETKKKYF